MKKVTLKRLTLRNFKGVHNLVIDFANETEILGANGTGKTTIEDAYNWLLYGKNSKSKTDFSIKTFDKNNKYIPKLEHEVEGVFDVDGVEIVFKRLYTEDWVVKRGNDFEELKGHKTAYRVDNKVKSPKEYNDAISEIANLAIFKIVSSPTYFNSKIDWKERRDVLSAMAGDISDEMILSETGKLNSVIELLNSNKSLDDEKKTISYERKRLKSEIKQIPSRIDEVDRMKPEKKDWTELSKSEASLSRSIADIDAQILDKNKALDKQREKISAKKQEKFNLQEQWNDLDRMNKAGLNAFDPELTKKELELKAENNDLSLSKRKLQGEIASLNSDIVDLQESNSTLTSDWKSKKVEVFPAQVAVCPTCKRDFENSDELIAEAKLNFNIEKIEILNEIEAKGQDNAKKIQKLTKVRLLNQGMLDEARKAYDTNVLKLKEIEAEKNKPKKQPEPTGKMNLIQNEIDKIVIPEVEPVDVSELQELKKKNNESLDAVNKELANKTVIDKANVRVSELKKQQKSLSQELATIEKSAMEIEKFQNAFVDLVERRTNDLFSFAKFKMFNTNINGGKEPTCVCVVDGVPYGDLNTAMQINVGLDIVSAMQHYHGILTPVFIDHAESVTSTHPMECQVVKLIVNDDYEELAIKHYG